MKPSELVWGLMAAAGISGPLPLAKAAGVPKKQPAIHRFLNGDTAELSYGTAEPIAKHFKVPLEAMFDERVATQVARDRGIPDPPPRVEAKARKARGPTAPALELARQFDAIRGSAADKRRAYYLIQQILVQYGAPPADADRSAPDGRPSPEPIQPAGTPPDRSHGQP